MVTLEWSLERTDGVTLVGAVVTADRPCRVRLENRLDGPVWPPRRHGQPAEGWDDGAYTGRVPASGRLTVGYATPAGPAEPPVEVVSTEPVADTADGDGSVGDRGAGVVPPVESSPAGVVRSLGDPVVPLDSVPVSTGASAEHETRSERTTEAGDAAECSDERERKRDESRGAPSDPDGPQVSSVSEHAPGTGHGSRAAAPVVPGAVRTWLDDVERRLAADRPSDGDAGDRSAAALGAARRVDRAALQRVRERTDALLARAESAGEGGDARQEDSDRATRSSRPVGPGGR